jgi:hypothetical protein
LIPKYSCDNCYVIEARTPENSGKLVIEFKNEKGQEHRGMFKDDREKDRARVLQANEWSDDSESDDDFKIGQGAVANTGSAGSGYVPK